MPLQRRIARSRVGSCGGARREPRRRLRRMPEPNSGDRRGRGCRLKRSSDRKIAARLLTRCTQQVECRMIPDYRDFTISSGFREAYQPPTWSALLTENWCGCRRMARAGILQADAYAGFGELYDGKRKPGPITEAACWSHGRRHFFEQADLRKAPLAVEAVQRIDEIFAIERTINGQPASDRLAVRQRDSKPIVIDLEKWMRAERSRLSRHAATAQAIDYMLTRWPAFTRFLDDGRICLSNNAAERALRGIALGRRSWLFAGS